MVVCYQISEVKKALRELRRKGKSIGLVPTMGALHKGHIHLLNAARMENDVVVTTIFVNPIQFNNPEDLEKYPSDMANDLAILKAQKCDFVFNPSVEEMYPSKLQTGLDFGSLMKKMEGAHRPGHFNGVGVVVAKLLNIIYPDRAYFGQKDIQQATIIKQLVSDLSFDPEIVIVPTVREEDGLAFSSRNRRLSSSQRKEAPKLYNALTFAQKELLKGEKVSQVKKEVEKLILESSAFRLDYFEIVNSETMVPVENINHCDQISLCIAGFIGEVRLLDNIYLRD